jgi:hypothetical protein
LKFKVADFGQYPPGQKEHIANEEQIVYSAVIAIAKGGAVGVPIWASVVGLPNPGHKEHET